MSAAGELNHWDPRGTEAIRVALTDALSCASPEGLCTVCREEVEHALAELDALEAVAGSDTKEPTT